MLVRILLKTHFAEINLAALSNAIRGTLRGAGGGSAGAPVWDVRLRTESPTSATTAHATLEQREPAGAVAAFIVVGGGGGQAVGREATQEPHDRDAACGPELDHVTGAPALPTRHRPPPASAASPDTANAPALIILTTVEPPHY